MLLNDPHIVFNNLVARFLSEELSSEELEMFRSALSEEPELKIQLKEYVKLLDSVKSVGEGLQYDLDAEWELMRQKIPGFVNETDRVVPGQRLMKNSAGSRSFLFYTYRIAAVLLVGLIFAFAWVYASRIAGSTRVVAGADPVEQILDDGTRVIINRDSKIRYSKSFGDTDRTVKLVGEAWFDVARDTARPFIIDVGSAEVEVLGTSFNVNAYKENLRVEITVASGVVALTPKQDRLEQIILKAGNGGSYDEASKELNLVPRADPNSISWKTRELFFQNSPLEEVANLVSTVYNAKLVIVNDELASCPITVTFRDQSLDAVLNVLASTLDLEITRDSGKIILDGAGCKE